MTKKEATSLLKKIRRALSGLDGEFINRILAETPVKDMTEQLKNVRHVQRLPAAPIDYYLGVCLPNHGSLVFSILFNSNVRDSYVEPKCEYITANGIGKTVIIEDETAEPAYFRTYGRGKYKYSFADISEMFESEPFYTNHLTGKDLQWFAYAVRTEMKEWDEWLKSGDVSRDKHDEHLSLTEERLFHQIAPYMDELNDIEEILKLFKMK